MYNPILSTAAWEAETHKQLEAQEDSLLGMQRGGQEALFLEHSPLKNPVPGRNRDFGLCLRERQQETTAIKCIVYLFFHSMFMGRSIGKEGSERLLLAGMFVLLRLEQTRLRTLGLQTLPVSSFLEFMCVPLAYITVRF